MPECIRLTSCILLALTAMAASVAAEIAWRESYYNPAPVVGDVVLPMPCGGAMVFRRISTGSPDGAIGDIDRTVGLEGDAQPYLNGLRKSYVAGAFTEASAEPGRTYYLLGKYELAAAQFDAVMEPECPETPRRRDFLPAADRSKLEFQNFAERYTLWLMQKSPGSLPAAGDTIGFARLPTEAEWEFAARGGESVEPVGFRAALPPMAEGADPSEFIAHGGTGSAGGTVQAIGTLKANPLGLHDMLGNVAEFVETPFALVRHGRLHGRSGGWVKRGGDARTPLGSLNSATRFEVAPFDAISKSPTRDRYTGARLAVAELAITSLAQADELAAGLARLAEVDAALPTAVTAEEVLAMLASMQADAVAPQLRSQLTLISDLVKQSHAERNALRDKALRLLLESGAWMCDLATVRLRNRIVLEDYLMQIADLRPTATDAVTQAQIDDLESDTLAKIGEVDQNVSELATRYGNLIEGLADDYSPEVIRRQADFVGAGLGREGRQGACMRLLAAHLDDRGAAGASDLAAIEVSFRDLAEREIREGQ